MPRESWTCYSYFRKHTHSPTGMTTFLSYCLSALYHSLSFEYNFAHNTLSFIHSEEERDVFGLLYVLINTVIPLQLTKHSNFSLPRQSAAHSLGFTAIYKSVVHLYIVDPEGTVME